MLSKHYQSWNLTLIHLVPIYARVKLSTPDVPPGKTIVFEAHSNVYVLHPTLTHPMSHGIFGPVEHALSIGEVECKGAVGVLASAIWAVSLVAEVAGHPIE